LQQLVALFPEVTDAECKNAREVHNAEREAIKASVAFGRRALTNPALFQPSQRNTEPCKPVTPAISFCRV